MFTRLAKLPKLHSFFQHKKNLFNNIIRRNHSEITQALINKGSAAWVADFFDDNYAATAMTWPREKQDSVAAAVERLTHLSPGLRAFDQCCGTGGLSLGLARRGVNAIGVDQSQSYIEQANRLAQAEKLTATFVQGDAYAYLPPQTVHAAISWYSSLGYGGPEGAQKLLSQLHQSVKPGGYWLVESANVDYIRAHFQPQLRYLKQTEKGPRLVERKSHWENNWLVQNWRITAPDDPSQVWVRNNTSCWHVPVDQFKSWISALGGELVSLHEDENQKSFSSESPRWVAVVRKL